MRILDCKSPVCSKIAAEAPVMIDYICTDCSGHFEAIRHYLDVMHIEYAINPRIVRGLDYYTRTVFEFVSSEIGAQGTVCGGGRYDGLVEEMGGPSVPSLGFALGLERLLLLIDSQGIELPRRRAASYISFPSAKGLLWQPQRWAQDCGLRGFPRSLMLSGAPLRRK